MARQDAQATLDAGFRAGGATAPRLRHGSGHRPRGPRTPTAWGRRWPLLPTSLLTTELDGLFGPDGIYTCSDQHGVAWERAISADFFTPDGAEAFQVECGLRIQGGAFRSHGLTLKHPCGCSSSPDYGPGKLRHPLFGPDGPDRFDTITLRANSNDGWQWSGAGDRPSADRRRLRPRHPPGHGRRGLPGPLRTCTSTASTGGSTRRSSAPTPPTAPPTSGGERDDWDAINSGTAVDGDLVAWNALLTALNAAASLAAYQAVTGQADAAQLIDPVDYADYMLTNLYVGNTDWPRRTGCSAAIGPGRGLPLLDGTSMVDGNPLRSWTPTASA
ncbi:MAG: hypothetical protein R3F43_19405 [bacterium]